MNSKGEIMTNEERIEKLEREANVVQGMVSNLQDTAIQNSEELLKIMKALKTFHHALSQ